MTGWLRHALVSINLLWAAPWTLLGLMVGSCSCCFGGSASRQGRVVEFHGPLLAFLLKRVPLQGGASAMTLGHCVLAADRAQLVRTRNHELVHVRQYERWGPMFVPAYFVASAWVWSRGGDPYWDNPFEAQAYRETELL